MTTSSNIPNETIHFEQKKVEPSNKFDNGWVDGVDICSTCQNRPGGPNNKSGFCMCSIPSMYGPARITC